MDRRNFLKINLRALTFLATTSSLLVSQNAVASKINANTNNGKIKVGIFLFNEVEVLDFAGPFEVFSLPFNKTFDNKIFDVITVSETGRMISAVNGLKVQPDYSFDTMPKVDIIIIPGGAGANEIEINNPKVINWIQEISQKVKITASVCTGAFLLAKAGLLDGKSVTTHNERIDLLKENFPSCKIVRNVKFVDVGNIITSGGISAGINMSFYLVKKLTNLEVAKTTAKIMEYDIDLDKL